MDKASGTDTITYLVDLIENMNVDDERAGSESFREILRMILNNPPHETMSLIFHMAHMIGMYRRLDPNMYDAILNMFDETYRKVKPHG